MRTFDLTPLMRSTVGFDRMSRFLDAALSADEQTHSYPPYNIEKSGEDSYRITMAVAGFSEADLDITATENMLVIKGARAQDEQTKYLHRGIATRAFERRFQLADYVKVVGAELSNGLLHVSLAREVPETLKPRSIAITNANANGPALEQKAA